MIRISHIIAFIIPISICYSQDTTFKVQSYKPQNIKDGILRLSFYEYMSGGNDEVDFINAQSDRNSDNFNNNIRLSAEWKFKLESPTSLIYSKLSPSFYHTFDNNEESRDYKKTIQELQLSPYSRNNQENNRIRGVLNYEISGGKYLINQLGLMGHLGLRSNLTRKTTIEKIDRFNVRYLENSTDERYSTQYRSNSEKKNTDIDLDIELALGPVWGRIYEGVYAVKAFELIDALKLQGILLREPSSKQINHLAEIIYEESNRYYFDSRLKRIATLDRIIYYLLDIAIIEDDAKSFLVLSDIYEYSNIRLSSNPHPMAIFAVPIRLPDFAIQYGTCGGSQRIRGTKFIYPNWSSNNKYYRPFGFQAGIKMYNNYSESNFINWRKSSSTQYAANYDSLWNITSSDTNTINNNWAESNRSDGIGSYGFELYVSDNRLFGWRWLLLNEAVINRGFVDTTNYFLFARKEKSKYKINPIKNYIKEAIYIKLSSKLLYTINSRSEFSFYYNLAYYYSKYNLQSSFNSPEGNVIKQYDVDKKMMNFVTGFECKYYLSLRLSLNTRLSYHYKNLYDVEYSVNMDDYITYSLNDYEKNRRYFNFNVGMEYYMF